jgi:hypothetical protein
MTKDPAATIFQELTRTPSESLYARRAGEGPVAFDDRIIRLLESHYSSEIDAALAILADVAFELDSLADIHHKQLRRSLLARQSLPYLIVSESHFPYNSINTTVLAAMLAAHTLALTQLDYHFDGTDPAESVPQSAMSIRLQSAVAYALRMTYIAGQLAGRHSGALFKSALNTISGFVVERMHEDWATRYSLPQSLSHAERCIDDYILNPTSRLMASGYWEAMTRAAFISHGHQQPEELTHYVRYIRKLRQLADESRDLEEDLCSGVITLPMLLRMALPGGDKVLDSIADLWRSTHASPRTTASEIAASIRCSALIESIVSTAHVISVEPPASETVLGVATPSLTVLVDVKLAVLELTLSEWCERC